MKVGISGDGSKGAVSGGIIFIAVGGGASDIGPDEPIDSVRFEGWACRVL